jgi:hypothetical protein
MRLLRVELTDVRGVAHAAACFARDGVTIVEAPNETGKTTLLEAVDVLLEVKDSSRSQRVQELQPVDRDVPSTIEVELTCGPYHLTCTKTYHRQTATVLTIHAPTRETLRGAEAHDRLRAILDAEVDPALYAALRYAQGRDLGAVPFGDSNVLAARLDAAAGGGGSSDEGGLLDRAAAEYLRWYTPTGRPGRALQMAEQELADATREHTAFVGRLAALRGDVEELDRIERRLPELRRRRTEQLEPELAAACAAVAEVHEGRTALAARRTDQLAAANELVMARRLVDERVERAARAAALRRDVDDAAAVAAREGDRLARAERRHEDLVGARQRATDAAQRGRRRCDEAQLVVELFDARAERDRLARRHDRVEQLAATAREARAALAVLRLDEDGLTAIRDAAQGIRVAEAAHAAGVPNVRLVARRDLAVVVDGEVVTLVAGEELSRTVSERVQLAVPGLAELDIAAGRSADRLQAAVDDARQRLRDACAAAGVADLDEAEHVAVARGDHLAVAQRCEADLTRELDGATPAALRAALAVAEERAGRMAEGLADPPPPDGGSTAAREAVLAARADADRADAELAAALAAQEEHAQELHALRTSVEVAGARLTTARRELDRIEQQLSAQRAAQGDDERLVTARTAAERREEDAARQLAAADQRLASLDPAAVEAEETAARAALAAVDRDLADLRTAHATLRERLRLGGEDGLGELVQHAADRLEQARVDHRRTSRRAEAARRLHTELTRARDEAYEAYRAPLCELISRDARTVFGPDLAVELDEDLCIVGRTLDGVTLPWPQLSAGAREQLAILAGLAAAQLAGSDGVPFVIDDALGYTDPARLVRLGEVLDRTADAQVIVLTCVADRFRSVRGARVVQLGDRTTASLTIPETAPAPEPPPAPDPAPVSETPPAAAAPAPTVATTLSLPLPGAGPATGAGSRPPEVARGRRRSKDGTAPRQGRERGRGTEKDERSARQTGTDRPPEVAALTLDLGPH